jgi:ubiquitin-like-conjugating enzyme ATG3
MNNLAHKLYKGYQDVVSYITPTLKQSKFYDEGKLTPEEFVSAGDFLVLKCPTWKWCSAKDNLYNSALPKDKQYLLTTVKSTSRATDYINENNINEIQVEDDWVEEDLTPEKIKEQPQKSSDSEEILNLSNSASSKEIEKVKQGNSEEKKVDKNEIDDFEIIENEYEDNKIRTYDVSVTYDFYYCVPRMWLVGYDSKGRPLTDNEMKEDIMPEYRNKTVTIEPQTCTGIKNISVHPCRHSLLLKKMINDYQESGKKMEIDMTILLFLKFLQSVVPTVQYDYTMDIQF